jgi:hypothetical protein
MTIHRSTLAVALALGACGGAKTPAPDSAAAAAPSPAIQASQMPAPDTMKSDTVKQTTADSAAKAAAKAAPKAAPKVAPKSTKADTTRGGFDRVRRPIGTIDEKTGRVDTIRKP